MKYIFSKLKDMLTRQRIDDNRNIKITSGLKEKSDFSPIVKWMNNNREFTDKIEAEYSIYLERWLATKKQHPDERIRTLTDFIEYLKRVEKLCEKNGRDYMKWFYEYLVKDNYLGRREEELASLKKNYNRICKLYDTQNNISPDIEDRIIDIIRKQPGILQTQVYDEFDVGLKGYISNKLSDLSKKGKIIRVRSGNTYSLTICD